MEKLQIQFDSDGYYLYKVAWDRYLVEHEGDDPMLLGPAAAKRWAEENWPDRFVLIDGLDEDDFGRWCELAEILTLPYALTD